MTHDRFEQLLPRLRRRARRLCRTEEEAQDLSQEAALRVWQKLACATRIDDPDRYAMVLLHNLARSRWRARRTVEDFEDSMLQTAPAAPARLACAEVRAAIARLPNKQQAVMRAVLAGETSPRQIAQRSGVPLGTVMSRLARARARLREDLQVDGSVVALL